MKEVATVKVEFIEIPGIDIPVKPAAQCVTEALPGTVKLLRNYRLRGS